LNFAVSNLIITPVILCKDYFHQPTISKFLRRVSTVLID